MDHESAHALYQTLKAYDAGAKVKQGLGFGNEAEQQVDRDAEQRRRDAAAAKAVAQAARASATGSDRQPRRADRRDEDEARRRSAYVRGRSRDSPACGTRSRASPDRRRADSRGASRHQRHTGDRQGDRWLMDDERQADGRRGGAHGRRSPARERDRRRSPGEGDRGSRIDGGSRRSAASNGHRQPGSRTADLDSRHTPERPVQRRDGGRDRDRDRDRGSNRDTRARPRSRSPVQRRRRSPSRNRSRSRSRSRHACERRDTTVGHSRYSGRTEPAERDRCGGRQQRRVAPDEGRPSAHRQPAKRFAARPKPAEPDWVTVIDGYDQMTVAMRLRARTRYQLQQATKKASDDGQQWTRFQFDATQPAEGDDDAATLDSNELPDDAGRKDVSHEAAIFGAPPKQDVSEFEDDDDLLPQVVMLPETAGDDALPAVVEQPAAPSQPKLSWREKAAQLRAQREAEQEL